MEAALRLFSVAKRLSGPMGRLRQKLAAPELRFRLLLARTLGRTLQELADSITAEEYGLWWAEYCRSPWGELRQDTGFGIVAATLANVNRGRNTAPFNTPTSCHGMKRRPKTPGRKRKTSATAFFG